MTLDVSPKLITLVIGGAGEIGLATVLSLVESGYEVWSADLMEHSIAASLGVSDNVRTFVVDVCDETSVDAILKQAWDSGRFHGVVYAAGTNYDALVLETNWSDYDRVMNVNLLGAFHVCKSIGKRLTTKPLPLSLVFISSVAGLTGESGGSVYCASKFGLIGLAQSFASEIAIYGGRANVVCPGNVNSRMLTSLAQGAADRKGSSLAAVLEDWSWASAYGRLIEPAEVGAACCWLMTPGSSGLSGQTLVIDGPPPLP
jgi:NAD(P)-dependent dehydrogenase (short-subunit alcohol dehydrogenase family)